MKKYLTSVFGTFTAILLSAQITPIEIIPPSSASLINETDYPVNPGNGIPEINIPLHTMTSGPLTMHLGINFNIDSYIQPNQLPDSPGAGWALSSDIQISRQIRGQDDFSTWGYICNSQIPAGYTGSETIEPDQDYKSRFFTNDYDEEPDKFYYRLLDRTGVFYFRKMTDGRTIPTPLPSDGTKISYTKNGKRQIFTITDTYGTTYEYSSDNIDYEKPSGDMPTPPLAWKCDKITNAARTDSITFSYIQVDPYPVYGYMSTGVDVYDSYSGTLTATSSTGGTLNNCNPVYVECPYNPDYHPESGTPVPPAEGTVTAPSTVIIGNPKYTYNEMNPLRMSGTTQLYIYDGQKYHHAFRYIHPEPQCMSQYKEMHLTYVKGIRFRSGSIRFTYAAGNDGILEKITIRDTSDATSNTIKTIDFIQNLAYEPGKNLVDENWNRGTRRLDTLIINNEIYSFSYSRNHNCGVITDFWGYDVDAGLFNGATYVPRQDVRLSLGAAASFSNGRDSVTIAIGSSMPQITSEQQEALMSMTYPTGGRVRFFTERHRYKDQEGVIRPAGGMRIARIDWYDSKSDNPVRQKFYRYGKSEDGCGLLKEPLDFTEESGNCLTEQRLKYYHIPAPSLPTQYAMFGSERKRSYLPNPTISAECGSGHWLLYPEVAEYDTEDGSVNGKTVYHYDTKSVNGKIYRPAISVAYPLEEHYWDVGALDSVVFYRYNSEGSYSPVRAITYEYNEYQEPERIYQGRIWPSALAVPVGFGGADDVYFDETIFHRTYSEFIHNCNSMAVGCMQLISSTERIYENDGSIRTMTTRHDYENEDTYFRPTSTTTTDWSGETTTRYNLYASDYREELTNTTYAHVSRNIISIPYEQVTVHEGAVVSAVLNIYDSEGYMVKSYSLGKREMDAADFRMSNRSGNGFPSDSTGTFNPDYSCYRLDAEAEYGPSKRLKTMKVTGECPVCYLWGYNDIYPVARIENATWEQVGSIDTQIQTYPSDAALHEMFTHLRDSLPEAMTTGYTYRMLLGINSITDPSGRTVFYEYDSNGRLTSIKNEEGQLINSYEYTLKNVK